MAAAHLGRPRADRHRLSLLRRHAARRPPPHQGRVGGRSAAAPGSRRRAADGRPAVVHVARAVGGVAERRLRHCAAQRAGAVPTHRVRAAQRQPHPGGAGRQRQPGVAEDRGHRRGRERLRAGAGGELPQLRIRRPHARRGAQRRASSGSSKNGRSTINCSASPCGWPAARSQNLEQPDRRLHRWRVDAARRGGGGQRHLGGDAARRCCGWSKRSSGWCAC